MGDNGDRYLDDSDDEQDEIPRPPSPPNATGAEYPNFSKPRAPAPTRARSDEDNRSVCTAWTSSGSSVDDGEDSDDEGKKKKRRGLKKFLKVFSFLDTSGDDPREAKK